MIKSNDKAKGIVLFKNNTPISTFRYSNERIQHLYVKDEHGRKEIGILTKIIGVHQGIFEKNLKLNSIQIVSAKNSRFFH